MNTTKKLGNKLKILREVHNYTQEYVANVLDVAPSTYFLMEKGQAQLTIDRIEKLASLYNMDLVDLLKLNDQTIIQQHFTHSSGVSESVTINNNGLAEDERNLYKDIIKRLEEQNDTLINLIKQLSDKLK
ncbi:MAG: hypothetical protein BGO31_03400 [Bacteroidetes bacterium 43-16]|nr:MAG: hypothetical protein BGO31_03400 [Bacteroidetes bacterium 43-16]